MVDAESEPLVKSVEELLAEKQAVEEGRRRLKVRRKAARSSVASVASLRP